MVYVTTRVESGPLHVCDHTVSQYSTYAYGREHAKHFARVLDDNFYNIKSINEIKINFYFFPLLKGHLQKINEYKL